MVASWGLPACGGTGSDASLRFDGLYCSPDKGEYVYRMFLRFYEDQTLQGYSALATPETVASFLDRRCSECGVGTWHLTSHTIEFTTTFSYGTIEFQGEVGHDQLNLNVHSLINDNQTRETYSFTAQKFAQ